MNIKIEDAGYDAGITGKKRIKDNFLIELS